MKKICFDRRLPEDKFRAFRTIGPMRLVAPLHKQWISGSTLQVRFIGGTPQQHEVVKREARWIEAVANIHFEFNNAPEAEIRITFNENDGAWSYIGTDCASIPSDQPTMNLGFLDPGTAAHELLHSMGCSHEHQNPHGGIVWNEAAVIQDLSGPPNFWDRDTIRHNVLEKYSHDQIKGTVFDPHSIMLYFFPPEWTQDGFSAKQNNQLSELDKAFLGGPSMYPKPQFDNVKRIYPNQRRTRATLRKAGEEDLFVFKAEQAGRYCIDTRGKTNVAMRLFGPNSTTALIAEDDDSGLESNAMIFADLIPGEYFVQIRHANLGNGKYTVKVHFRVFR